MKVRILLPGRKADDVISRCGECGVDGDTIRATRGIKSRPFSLSKCWSDKHQCYGKPLHGAKNNRRNQRRRTVTTGLRNLLLRAA